MILGCEQRHTSLHPLKTKGKPLLTQLGRSHVLIIMYKRGTFLAYPQIFKETMLKFTHIPKGCRDKSGWEATIPILRGIIIPTYTHPMGTLGQANNNVVCYKCGQSGHIKPNCPRLRDRQRVAGARIEEILSEENLDDMGEPSPVPLVINDDPPQVDTNPPERDGEGRVAITDWASQSSQYHWDDFEDQ